MLVRVIKARQRPDEYYFEVLVNCDQPEEDQALETFHYGRDVSLQQIAADFKALIHNKYETPTETVLAMEGNEYEV